jgi:methylated-DNA-protein-cysteine methyltransferase-like protein
MAQGKISACDDNLTLNQRFLLAVAALQVGEVVSYGDIAARAGSPKHSRAVGRFLATAAADLPWWRIVRSNSQLVSVNPSRQARLLLSENVVLNAQQSRVVKSPLGRFS